MGFVDNDGGEDFGPSNKGRSLPPEDYQVGTWLTGIVREGKEIQRTMLAAEGERGEPQFWRPNGSYEIEQGTGRRRYWTTEATDPKTGKPNRPMTQWRVEMDTDYRSTEIPHDDGVRFLYVRGGRKNPSTSEAALVQAMVAAGVTDFSPGDKIAMRKTSAKRNTSHEWEARYEKGSGSYEVKPRIDAEGKPWVPGDEEDSGFVGGSGGQAAAGDDPWATPSSGDDPWATPSSGDDPWATPSSGGSAQSTQDDSPPF